MWKYTAEEVQQEHQHSLQAVKLSSFPVWLPDFTHWPDPQGHMTPGAGQFGTSEIGGMT